MSVKGEVFDEVFDLLTEEITIKEDHDIDAVVVESQKSLKCRLCPYDFPSLGELRLHYGSHHSGHKCVVCSKTFKTKGAYCTHYLEKHSDEARVACGVCGKKWASESRLREHMKKHGKCSDCGSAFKSREELSKHISKSHPLENSLQCKVCSKRFTVLSLLKLHSVKHNEEKPYKCDQCSSGYKRKSDLKGHEAMVHRDEGRFPCEVCGTKFFYRSRLTRHLETHSKERNHKCTDCGCAFKSQEDLTYHTKLLHSTETPFQCEVCPKSFSTSSLLKKHCEKHSQDKPFECDRCSSAYKKKQSLNNHTATVHNKKCKLHQCQVCSKKFKVHSEEKTFECFKRYKCDYSSITYADLTVNSEDGPFQRNLCPKTLKSDFCAKTHLKIAHKITRRDFSCGSCFKKFRLKASLDKHVKDEHETSKVKIEPIGICDPEINVALEVKDEPKELDIKKEPEDMEER